MYFISMTVAWPEDYIKMTDTLTAELAVDRQSENNGFIDLQLLKSFQIC